MEKLIVHYHIRISPSVVFVVSTSFAQGAWLLINIALFIYQFTIFQASDVYFYMRVRTRVRELNPSQFITPFLSLTPSFPPSPILFLSSPSLYLFPRLSHSPLLWVGFMGVIVQLVDYMLCWYGGLSCLFVYIYYIHFVYI